MNLSRRGLFRLLGAAAVAPVLEPIAKRYFFSPIGGWKVQEAIDEEKPDAVVIDGDGIGGAVYDYLKARGYDRKTVLVEFHGGYGDR